MVEQNSIRPGISEAELAVLRTVGGADLYRALFRTPSPEAAVRAMAPQAVYLALQGYGLESGLELLQIVPPGHYRLFLDLQFWEKDSFSEEAFWRWLEVVDQETSLEPLGQFVRAADERILARVIGAHVHAIIGEEKAEAPPADGYFTPDQGYTWVSILGESQTRARLLARLLAMIFQVNPSLFYQLLNIAGGASASELEEDAFREKSRRLADEGLPDLETTTRLHAPLDADALNGLFAKGERGAVPRRAAFSPVIHSGSLEPLTAALGEALKNGSLRSDLEAELSLLINAAVLRFSGSMADTEGVIANIGLVRGTLNIGLERACLELKRDAAEILSVLGLQPLYRTGLGELREFRRRIRERASEAPLGDEPAVRLLVEGALSGDLPRFPHSLRSDGTLDSRNGEERAASPDPDLSGAPSGGETRFRPYSSLQELATAERIIVGRAH